MNKKIMILIVVLLVFVILILFYLFHYKTGKFGNNINKSTDEMIRYILNINSYEAEIEVTVQSNKTTNQYKLKQYYVKPNTIKQTIEEPVNLENLTIIYDGNNMKIENTNLSLSKIYQNYEYLSENVLWLSTFIDQYNEHSKIKETNEEIIIENVNTNNIYYSKQILYINKKTILPTRLEITDNNKNNKIYIKYNEIKFNKIKQEEILAFQIENLNLGI